MNIRVLTEAEVTFEITALPEDRPVTGNLVSSGDPLWDAQQEADVIRRLESNIWAWCLVAVIARWDVFHGIAYLGKCSYESEEAFKQDAYYAKMRQEALDDLNQRLQQTAARVSLLAI